MSFFPNPQTLVSIGPLSIRWYAVLICFGAILAYILSKKQMRISGLDDETIDDITIGVVFCGFIGARLWYCLLYDPMYYFSNPIRLLQVYNGGLAIHGGLIGGLLFAFFYCKKHRYSLLRIADCIFPNVLLAQAIGRWGNFVNQEAYGGIISQKDIAFLPKFIQDGMLIDGYYRQPMFLVESVMDIAGFIIIAYVMSKWFKLKRGDRSYCYLIWYGISRFIVEIFRTDALMVGSLKMAQVLSVIAIIIGLLGYIGLFEKWFKPKKPVVLFDFDGTLVDTSKAIGASMYKTLKAHGKEDLYTDQFKKDMLGPAPHVLFEQYCPDLDSMALQEEYRQYNWDDQKTYNELFTDTILVLDYLKEHGYTMGIVSTKAHNVVEYGLDMFKLKEYFGVIIGGDDVKNGKPDPEGMIVACDKLQVSKDNALYIGDSVSDMKAGKAAGMFTVAFLSYESKREDLSATDANEHITALNELIPILEGAKIFSCNGR